MLGGRGRVRVRGRGRGRGRGRVGVRFRGRVRWQLGAHPPGARSEVIAAVAEVGARPPRARLG